MDRQQLVRMLQAELNGIRNTLESVFEYVVFRGNGMLFTQVRITLTNTARTETKMFAIAYWASNRDVQVLYAEIDPFRPTPDELEMTVLANHDSEWVDQWCFVSRLVGALVAPFYNCDDVDRLVQVVHSSVRPMIRPWRLETKSDKRTLIQLPNRDWAFKDQLT